jgi:hypothetical protein
MDNERKMSDKPQVQVKELVERSKMIFLQEIVEEFRHGQAQYDLEAEFAKTKKNRSLVIPGVILGLIVLFSVVVVGVTRYIQAASRSIQVDIDDFADVNLRDVLDEAQRLQNQLETAQRQLRQLQSELAENISRVERERDRGIQLLQDQGLTAAQRSTRADELSAQAESEIESLQEEYTPRITELEERIDLLRVQIAEYDSRQLEQAREQEETLNNQQQIAELEKQELREEYEAEIARITESYESEIGRLESFQEEFERTVRQRHADELAALRAQHQRELSSMYDRYNPVFDDDLQGLVNRSFPEDRETFGPLEAYSSVLDNNRIASNRDYTELQQRYRELQQIVRRMQEIPYENSMDPALRQLESRIYDLVVRYEELWTGLLDAVVDRDVVIAEQESTIDEFTYSVDELARLNGETGFIIDPRNSDHIIVHIASVRTVREGALGYVFRRDDEFIGSVRFVRRDGKMVARLVETVEDQEIRAFDKILIEAQ